MLPKPIPAWFTRRLHSLTPILVLLAILPLAALLHAGSAAERFDQANLLYEKGSFHEAADAYRSILDTGVSSAALHFNLGNACFRLGQLGRAIAHYRLAQRLSPRDADIAANLQFARQQAATSASLQPGFVVRQLQWLTLDEWALLTAAHFWLLCALLTLRQFRPAADKRLRGWTLGAGLATVLLLGVTTVLWQSLRTQTIAVVIQPEIEIRFGPVAESPVRFTAYDGTELRARDQTEDWVEVLDGSRRVGWARRADLLLVP